MVHSGRNIEIQDIQSSKQEGCQNADIRAPDGEDYKGDSQPASVTESIVGPYAAGIVHNIVETAKSCDHTSDTGCDVFIFCYVNTCCICSTRVLADCTKLKAHTGVMQNIGCYQRNEHCQICQEAVGQEQFSKPAQFSCKGKGLAEKSTGCRQGNGGNIAVYQFDQRTAKEVTKTNTKCSHGKSCYILICSQCHGQETI